MRYAAPPVPAVNPANNKRPSDASTIVTGAVVVVVAFADFVLNALAPLAQARVAVNRCIVVTIAAIQGRLRVESNDGGAQLDQQLRWK